MFYYIFSLGMPNMHAAVPPGAVGRQGVYPLPPRSRGEGLGHSEQQMKYGNEA